ncbi:TIGR02281 family clan AA aspartic protease [Desulfonema ishimotonii]|uniref:TIGR02281 family clan AA aspartic protease n=1 Tax=Desulfonema ishimotonii TaxID=45657 RepID=A0A401G3Q6_9BACT|nr:TIGR02281 family clan AA aspartic protease [Desulfonema ishimotonii]GBC63811.1 TIGR02281 family clan AA aspartic protease [Desulfonema ishimotonii]
MVKRFLIILGLSAASVLLLNRCVPEPLTWGENADDILYGVVPLLWLSFIGARSGAYFQSERLRRNLKYGALWIGIFLIIAVAHSYRFELAQVRDRVLANLIPGRQVSEMSGEMRFQISPNGHFYIRAAVNGVPVRFLADTGATDIVITPGTAERLGFSPDRLRFDRLYQTANGPGRGASVRLAELTLGDLRLRDVPASVNESPMSESLLGMSFFNRLKGYTVRNGILTLYW